MNQQEITNQQEIKNQKKITNQQEFDQIYPKNITPGQHEVLDLWLQGKSNREIATAIINKAIDENNENNKNKNKNVKKLSPPDVINDKLLKSTEATVRSRFSEIFKKFYLQNKPGEHEQIKEKLMQLFIYYRSALIPYEHKLRLAEDISGYKGLYLRHYVERPTLEDDIRQKVQNCFSLRIKDLKDTGKTFLLNKVIIPEAKRLGYFTVSLNLGIANTSNLNDENEFFKWLCNSIKEQLTLQLEAWNKEDKHPNNPSIETIINLKEKMENFKYQNLGGTGSDKFIQYLQKILNLINQPKSLLLALDDVDYVFQYNDVAHILAGILRNILTETDSSFKGLCLVILHSTEKYAKLGLYYSPLEGIGIPYRLGDFNKFQIKELLRQYRIIWTDEQLDELVELVGGHPFLIKKAFEDSDHLNITPKNILKDAATNGGIYFSLFRQQLETLNLPENSRLKEKFKIVIMSQEPIELDANSMFLLQSMGLIKINGDSVTPRCKLYRDYFKKELNRHD